MLKIASLALIVVCIGVQTSAGQEFVRYENRADIGSVRVTEPGAYVFRSIDEWEAFFWDNYKNPNGLRPQPLPPLPAIDFQKKLLIGVFWGPRSGCRGNAFAAERIRYVESKGDRLIVDIGPIGDLGLCRRISFPMQLIEIPRIAEEVVFTGVDPSERP